MRPDHRIASNGGRPPGVETELSLPHMGSMPGAARRERQATEHLLCTEALLCPFHFLAPTLRTSGFENLRLLHPEPLH